MIGKGASCAVHLATVKVDGSNKDMQVAVKCTKRQNLRSLDEENLKEEVRCTGGHYTYRANEVELILFTALSPKEIVEGAVTLECSWRKGKANFWNKS